MKTVHKLGVVALFICFSAHGEDCGNSISNLQPLVGVEYIKSRFAASDFTCANRATQLLAASFSTLPGRNGFDARFALRETALVLLENKSAPSSGRIELIKSAAYTLTRDTPGIQKVEVIADVHFLLAAVKQFQKQKDVPGWLDTLEIAVRLDRHLPDPDRTIQSWMIEDISDAAMSQDWKRLSKIAVATRGDDILMGFRSRLAGWIYSYSHVWKDGLSREQIIERCKDLLSLIELLNDTPSGYDCKTGKLGDYGCSMDWVWWPTMRIGVAYHKLGMKEDAKKYIDEALKIIRESKPEHRLGLLQYALADLARAQYDRPTLLAVVADMKVLANSQDTPIAKEIRANLSGQYYGSWGFLVPR